MRNDKVTFTIKASKITLYKSLATGMCNTKLNANINGVAFNLDFINKHDPELTEQILDLFTKAKDLK